MLHWKGKMNRLIFVTIALVFSLLLLTGINAQDGITVTDVNDDGVVDILDLTYVASHFGESSDPTQTPNPDVNGDGIVNILDLVIVANMIGDGETEMMPSDNTLIFGRGGDSITLDPSQVLDGESAKVCDMIFDTLVQYREDTTDIEPALAVAWDSSADGLTWTFQLRQGVQFHDGTPFNANVAAFSITRPNAQTGDLFDQFISQIIALDEFTLQFQLKTPYAPFLSTLASTENSIVSQAAVAHFGLDFGNNPVGTGPFKFVQWDRNDQIVLTANDTHWAGKPAIDKLIFRSIPDNADRFAELQQGNLHAMEFPNPDDLALIQGDSRLELVMQPSLNVGYLAMNMEKPPFDNLKVRLAINHAFNKVEIIERLYQGTGIPAKNPIPPTLWGYDDSI
jgi:peptide/nickel transport system substrate-binding protein